MADFIQMPDWARPVPTPDLAPTSQWSLQMPGISPILLRGAGLVGRDPEPEPGEEIAHTLAVGPEEFSVSKTHLAFGVDTSGFWVVDRHSTNGVVVHAPDGTVTKCEPGTIVYLPSGGRVCFGDLEFTATLA